jgi:hypothetical protein
MSPLLRLAQKSLRDLQKRIDRIESDLATAKADAHAIAHAIAQLEAAPPFTPGSYTTTDLKRDAALFSRRPPQ